MRIINVEIILIEASMVCKTVNKARKIVHDDGKMGTPSRDRQNMLISLLFFLFFKTYCSLNSLE